MRRRPWSWPSSWPRCCTSACWGAAAPSEVPDASVLVLTAAAGVSDAAAAAAAGAVAGTPRRLAASAVEIGIGRPLPEGFAAEGCDANLVPASGRRKRLLVADMDSTIIGVECIDELADF